MRVTGAAPDKLVWQFGLRRSYVAAAETRTSTQFTAALFGQRLSATATPALAMALDRPICSGPGA